MAVQGKQVTGEITDIRVDEDGRVEISGETLRKELAGVTGVYHGNKINVDFDFDKMFYSFARTFVGGVCVSVEEISLNDIWHHFPEAGIPYGSGYIEFDPSKEYTIYTKNAWKYPWGGVDVMLPSLPVVIGVLHFFGFEPGPGAQAGLCNFLIWDNHLSIDFGRRTHNIDGYLPADYDTAAHRYFIKVNRPNVEYFIDNDLVAIGIRSRIPFTNIAGPPYEIVGSDWLQFDEAPAFIEADSSITRFDLGHDKFWAMEGDPCPPRAYRLYETGTNDLLAGMAVDPDVTSHPFPLFGYAGKTINFMADEAGTLSIQVLKMTDNWREYDSVAIAANTLESYTITAEEILGRIVFTPTAAPANILEAETHLR